MAFHGIALYPAKRKIGLQVTIEIHTFLGKNLINFCQVKYTGNFHGIVDIVRVFDFALYFKWMILE